MLIVNTYHTTCPHCGTKVEYFRMHKGSFDVQLPGKCSNCGETVIQN